MDANAVAQPFGHLITNFGFGVAVSVVNIIALLILVAWVLRTSQKREEKLTCVIDNSIVNLNLSVQRNIETSNQIANTLSTINGEVRGRLEGIQRANEHQREEHKENAHEVKEIRTGQAAVFAGQSAMLHAISELSKTVATMSK